MQEWGPLNSKAFFGTSEGAPDHYVVSLLEEYHASYAQREQNKKLYDALREEAYSEVGKKYRKRIMQLQKTGRPLPESLLAKMGQDVALLMFQKKRPTENLQSSTSKHLIYLVEDAIINNRPKFFLKLANSIKRIHGDGKRIKSRITGAGPTFKIEPHDPILLAGLEQRAEQKLSLSKTNFQKAVHQATGIRVGDKKAQRTLRELGVPPSKGGRPRKH